MTILMFDDVNASLLPSGYSAYAGYVNGRYANVSSIRKRFPSARVLSIDVNGSNTGADCLDVEPGDATNSTAVRWVKAKLASGSKHVVVYTSVSNVNALVSALTAAGVSRGSYKIWSAHYGDGAHICGPGTCKLTSYTCDGTQFTSTALGESLDESILLDTFFGGVAPAPVNSNEPTLIEGDTGTAVSRLQTQLSHSGIVGVRGIAVDGDFGSQTLTAVRNFQSHEHLTIDGVVGPQTWTALDSASPYGPKPAPAPTPLPKPPAPASSVSWSQWPASTTLKSGSTGAAVKVLQTALSKSGMVGVRGIGVDGDFGSQTLTSLRNFQSEKKLTVDGIAGPQTRAALEKLNDL